MFVKTFIIHAYFVTLFCFSYLGRGHGIVIFKMSVPLCVLYLFICFVYDKSLDKAFLNVEIHEFGSF